MLTNETFSITFSEFIPDSLGSLGMEAERSSNYFADNYSRKTMCCGCDK